MKFIHGADLHIDSPLKGLTSYEGCPDDKIRQAPRQAFVNLVDLAIEECVDFVILAGDVFDGHQSDFKVGLFFHKQLARLNNSSIPVFMIHGNHDFASSIIKKLPKLDNVHVFSAKKPESFEINIDGQIIALHGQSFGSRDVSEDLTRNYPNAKAGAINIGVLHTSLEGSVDHNPYAPTSVTQLGTLNYDYWALGHIHKAALVSETPLVVYPGNIQGRSVKETGAKGCVLVSDESGKLSVEWRYLDTMRWAIVQIDATGIDDIDRLDSKITDALEDAIDQADRLLLAARIHIEGSTELHGYLLANQAEVEHRIRAIGTEFAGEGVWIEKIRFKTQTTLSEEEMRSRSDALGGLISRITAIKNDNDQLEALAGYLQTLDQKLPRNIKVDADTNEVHLDPTNPETIKAMMDDVRDLLTARLMEQKS